MLNRKTSLLFLPYRIRMCIYEIDRWISFKLTCLFKKPYFGIYLDACMQPPERLEVMNELIESEISKAGQDFKILEVGSWCGHSSTLWASVCNNIRASGVKDYIVPIRGTSDEMAEILKEAAFDLIYIDGDHAYSQFKRDLINYSKLCKIGGVLCGDDLPFMTTRDDLDEFFKEHKEENAVRDPITKINCCPGVFVAMKEFFGKDGVSVKDGFWAVRKSRDGWDKIQL
ncbi:MAG: Methyltransferase domain protein [Candidatus Magasanikbacteria bacterium GW2011_GWA2_41_55]|uniref:Methyltransferase domain protein n=1 Tax=Candidatus Magasanikbacteria bacterium GW2011_GWA2_41_55 TaxID=1619038 RepID=A0A0G0ZL13_9BACT|nr:MAG: Methyltransferase domain protein [Candidatus Magasanikbacteria bacterium GW2011_GWA2_41_55]